MGRILFQLTPEIIDIIIFGMENQSEEYFVDIKTGDILSEADASEKYDVNMDDYVIPIPDWLPVDGFQLMESFVSSLHNPVQRDSLREVLITGKGAFRNFKSIIKADEFLSRQWYLHKEKVMHSRVIEWYNLNSEVLKYQDINENTDETEDLVMSDFIFSIDSPEWENIIESKISEAIRESVGDENAVFADYVISRNRSMLAPGFGRLVFICAEIGMSSNS